MCEAGPTYAKKADRSSGWSGKYVIEADRVAVEVDLDSGPVGILVNAFNPADLPFVLVKGVDVVVLLEFLVEVVGLELAEGFAQHLLIY